MSDFFLSLIPTSVLVLVSLVLFGWWAFQMTREQLADPGKRPWLLLIACLGLALRLGWILWTHPEQVSDFGVYYDYAARILHGNFAFTAIQRHPGPGIVYSIFFFLLGQGNHAIWIANLLFSLVTLFSVFALTESMINRFWAYLAMLLATVMPQMVAYAALAASESISVPFSLLFLWVLSREWRKIEFSWPRWLLIGILLYGNILIRSTAILYLGVVPLVILLQDRGRWQFHLKAFGTMALTTGVLLCSWMYHQYLVTEGHGFKMFWGAELGFALAVESEKAAYLAPQKYSFYPKVASYYAHANTPRGFAIAIEKTGEEAGRIIRKDPVKYLKNGFPRMGRVLNTAITGIYWSTKASPLQAKQKLIRRLGTVSTIFWKIVLYGSPLSILYFRQWRKQDQPAKLQFLSCFLYVLAWLVFHFLFALSSERYNIQLMPYMIILFASGLYSLVLALPSRQGTPAGKT